MINIYKCPKCCSILSNGLCSRCNYEVVMKNGIFDFLDDKYSYDLLEKKYHYYANDSDVIQEKIADKIGGILTSGNVLDLGCGDGALAKKLLKYKFNLYCLDSSFFILDTFKKDLSKNNSSYDPNLLTFLRADAHDIPIINGVIDLVIVNNLFHLLKNPKAVLLEIYRVLANGGKLVLISDSALNTYKESGCDLELFNNYKDEYSYKYWKMMEENGYFKAHINADFNQYIEANNLFIFKTSVKSDEINYSGSIKIRDFIEKEYSKDDFLKRLIPTSLHEKVSKVVICELNEKYGIGILDKSINYEGINTSILDIYIK